MEGLSWGMFFLAFTANICYGIAVGLRVPELDLHFLQFTLPFLIGSLGTLLFDAIILSQLYLYRNDGRQGADDDDNSIYSNAYSHDADEENFDMLADRVINGGGSGGAVGIGGGIPRKKYKHARGSDGDDVMDEW